MANIDFPSNPVTGQQYTFAGVTYTFTAQGVWSPSSSIVTTTTPQGRLTLQSSNPVMVSNTSGATTIYYTPYVGNRIPLYDGTKMVMVTFAETLGSANDATKNPTIIGSSKVNDWFIWNDNGTIRLGHGPDWTDDSTRSAGTSLVRVSGILLNANTITNGPAAQRGTYVGTTRSNATSSIDWLTGGVALGGSPAWFGIWNTYNRVTVCAMIQDSTASWSYGTPVWHPFDSSNGNRISLVTGLDEDWVTLVISGPAYSTTIATAALGIGIDSTSVPSGAIGWIGQANIPATLITRLANHALGFHFYQGLEHATGTFSFYGIYNTTSGQWGTGLFIHTRM